MLKKDIRYKKLKIFPQQEQGENMPTTYLQINYS